MITLTPARMRDCAEIHRMQQAAFQELLHQYHDIATNPGAETVAQVIERMEQPNTDYYFIALGERHIGAIRIVSLSAQKCRIAPIFILPEYQGMGYAQQTLSQAERMYPNAVTWELDTIQQEQKLCHLYEKMGYVPTGKKEQIQDNMSIIFYRKTVEPQAF